jgi:hypothetical protein
MFTYREGCGGDLGGERGLAMSRCARAVANFPNCRRAQNGTKRRLFCLLRISFSSRISASAARSTRQKIHLVASARVLRQTPVRNFQPANDLQHGPRMAPNKTRKSPSASAVLCARQQPPQTKCRWRAAAAARRNPHFRPTRVDRLDHLSTCVTCPSYRLVAQPFLTIMKASNNRTLGTFAEPSFLFASDANLPS